MYCVFIKVKSKIIYDVIICDNENRAIIALALAKNIDAMQEKLA